MASEQQFNSSHPLQFTETLPFIAKRIQGTVPCPEGRGRAVTRWDKTSCGVDVRNPGSNWRSTMASATVAIKTMEEIPFPIHRGRLERFWDTLWWTNIAMENGHLEWIFPLKMVIFHCYVSSSECNPWRLMTSNTFKRISTERPSRSDQLLAAKKPLQHRKVSRKLVLILDARWVYSLPKNDVISPNITKVSLHFSDFNDFNGWIPILGG